MYEKEVILEAIEYAVGGYLVSTDPDKLDLSRTLGWLRDTPWARSFTMERLRIAVANSLCVGAYLERGQVGFARLVTDHATFGYLTDVYVDSEHRGRGLAHEMSGALLGHESVASVDHFALIASGAAARRVYEGIGFSASGLAPDPAPVPGFAEGRAGAGWMELSKKG